MLAHLLDSLITEAQHASLLGDEARRVALIDREPYIGYSMLWSFRYARFAARVAVRVQQLRERIIAVYGDEKEEATRQAIDAMLRRNF